MSEGERSLPAVPHRSTLSVCSKGFVLNWDSLSVDKREKRKTAASQRDLFHVPHSRQQECSNNLKRLPVKAPPQFQLMSAEFELCFSVNATGISLRSSSLITTTICIPLSSPLFFFCFLFLAVCFCFSSCHKRPERCRVDWLQAGYCLPFTEKRGIKFRKN